ncbi:hypothetical protein M8998_07745 [Sphingobacterium sp. lm-10]|uniref:hypothetical protein n=1 Tax=Sphingobacterium sp. lm-10 TaxID=2944904 RepID=UPI002021EEE3|nr:hypothetical protein [Sphingobacterium sp. lm-10]MCL7987829.1 hypothetical protein [Sphingobacterium sp. lm-10]
MLAKDAAHRVLISGAAGTFPEFTAQPFSFSVFKSSASSESYADTVILEEIHIHRKIIHPDSLQVHDYLKNLSKGSSPSWKKVFINRSSLKTPVLPNRTGTTSSLVYVDLLTLIGGIAKKKRSKVENQSLLDEKERYIEQHFDSTLVKQLTGLSGDAISEFVRINRPSADDLSDTIVYELMKHIKTKYYDR